MIRVRMLPGGVLHVSSLGRTLRPGWEGDLPRDVVERHAGRFAVLRPDDTPPAPLGLDVSEYHTGGGWYELPNHTGKMRRAEAELLVRGS